jgi:NADPH-dependent glutamate synthase beta subunit-like oxidoreductase
MHLPKHRLGLGAEEVGRIGQRFAMIGAGAGGLCAAKHLLANGIEVTIFEEGSQVGGL